MNFYCNLAKARNDISIFDRSFDEFILSLAKVIDDKNWTGDFMSSINDLGIDKDIFKIAINSYLGLLSKNWIDPISQNLEGFYSLMVELENDFLNLYTDDIKNIFTKTSNCFESEFKLDDNFLRTEKFELFLEKADRLSKLLIDYSSDLELLTSDFSSNLLKSSYNHDYLQIFLGESIGDEKKIQSVAYFIEYFNPYWLNNLRLSLGKISVLIYNIKNIVINLKIDLLNLNSHKKQISELLLKYDDNYIFLDNYEVHGDTVQVNNDIVYDYDHDLYKSSFDLLKQYKLLEARESFFKFLTKYPKSKYMINVWYWLAEIEYELQRYDHAYSYYLDCYQLSSSNDIKHFLSLVKISLSLSKMKGDNHLRSCEFLLKAKNVLNNGNDYFESLLSQKIVELKCIDYFK